MTTVRVFVDDERFDEDTDVILRSYKDFCCWVDANLTKDISIEVDFDWNLGYGMPTGRDCLDYLLDKMGNESTLAKIRRCNFHSSDRSKRYEMKQRWNEFRRDED